MVGTRRSGRAQANGNDEGPAGPAAADAVGSPPSAKRRKQEPSAAAPAAAEAENGTAPANGSGPATHGGGDGSDVLDGFRKLPQLRAALETLQTRVDDSAVFLRPSPEVAAAAREVAKLLYQQCARYLLEGGGPGAGSRAERRALRNSSSAPLPELHTDTSFDPEQIWLQLEPATEAAVRRVRRLIRVAEPLTAGGAAAGLVTAEAAEGIDRLLSGGAGDSDDMDEDDEGEEDEEAALGGSDLSEGEEDVEEEEEEELEGQPRAKKARREAGSKAKAKAKGNGNGKAEDPESGRKGGRLEDRFFRLSDLERYVEDAERRAVAGSEDGDEDLLGRSGEGEEGEEGEEEEDAERRHDGAGGPSTSTSPSGSFPRLAGGKWYLSAKHYLAHAGSRITAYDVHLPSGTLALGFSSGVFELQQLVPELTCLHTLSVSRERITSLAFNHTGDWLAVGCARLGQLLVWEWRSETYVLKQQGHYHDIAAVAFSPDGALIATGADDCKVKVFQQSTGFCFVTFSEHTAPVTSLVFLPSGAALLTASLDGTVRAWDLVRYRNFRTLTSPTPAQYGSLAVDPAGEVVVAGAVDTFQIYVWSLKTGRLLDVLAGHEGPVTGLAFSPVTSLLASSSWDRTVRTWDVYDSGGSGSTEVLEHRHDVLAVAMRPDGRQLAAAAADGSIYLWDPVEGQLQGTIEGRLDIRGGRLQSDRRTASNSSAGSAFTSLAYSADGALLLAGGKSKYVCVYDVAEKLLLRRFQLSHNLSLDGVLDCLNTKNMTDAGPLQLISTDDTDDLVELLPPTTDLAAAADVPGTAAGKRPLVRCRCVALSPTGRVWAAASTEGLLLYGTDDGLIFDPTDLTQDITPAAVHSSLAAGAHLRALIIALRLGDQELVRHVLLATPPSALQTTAAGLPAMFVPVVLGALADCAANCPHLEFVLSWIRTLCTAHGSLLKAAAAGRGSRGAAAVPAAALMPVLRSLQKVLGGLHGDLAAAAETNMYQLNYLTAAAAAAAKEAPASPASGGMEEDD